MGETIPCPRCGGPVYDGGYLDAGDLIDLHGCEDWDLADREDGGE